MATLNVNPATILAALNAAQAGDVLKLESGLYGRMTSKLAAGRDLAGVVIDAGPVDVDGVFWLTRFHGLRIVGGRWTGGVRLDAGTRDVTVEGIETFGDGSIASYGVQAVNGASNIKVLDCEFRGHKSGVALGRVDGFEIRGNGFRQMRNDCISAYGVSKGLVAFNRFMDTRPATAAEHPDMAQFAALADWPVRDVVIRGNYGRALNSQGIVMFNHEGSPGSARVTIEDNDITVGYYHGIAWNGCEGLTLRRNRVASFPGSPRFATINVPGNTFAEPRFGNVVEAGAGRAGYSEPADPGAGAADLAAELAAAKAAELALAETVNALAAKLAVIRQAAA